MSRPSRIPSISIRRCGLVLLAVLVTTPAAALPLFESRFDAPLDQVGLPPALGDTSLPRRTPTKINFGDPTVVAAYGPLTNQPLLFTSNPITEDPYDQIEYDLTAPGVPYDPALGVSLQFDVTIELQPPPLVSNFHIMRVFIDAPTSFSFGLANRALDLQAGQLHRIEAIALPELSVIRVLVDGGLKLEMPMYGSPRTIRFSHHRDQGDAAIDNVLIYNVPEPSTALLLGVALALLGTRRRRAS